MQLELSSGSSIVTNFANYYLAVALYAMSKGKKDLKNPEAGSPALKKEMERFLALVEFRKLYSLLRLDGDVERRANSGDFMKVVSIYPWIQSWVKNHLANVTAVPSEEKAMVRFAANLVKDAFEGVDWSSTKLATGEKYARKVSASLGNAFVDAFIKKDRSKSEIKDDIVAAYKELKSLVKSVMGTAGMVIPTDKQKELKLSKDGAMEYMRYRDLKAKINKSRNALLFGMVSEEPMDVDKAAKELLSHGYESTPFPTKADGFKGKVGVDESGKITLYTTAGKQLTGNVAEGSKVTMNPKYDPELDNAYYCRFRAPNAVSDTQIYTTTLKAANVEEKHTKTKTYAGDIGKWVKTWERDVILKDPMRHVPAAVALILYLTAARIGTSKENQSLTGKEQTYGISTLRKEHVRVSASSIILDYRGKKGMQQKHVIKLDNKIAKRLAVILKGLLEGKRKGDLVFSFPRPNSRTGAIQEVNPAFFRKYLKASGCPVNPHALRHIRGTNLAEQLIAERPWKPSAKARTLSQRQKEAEEFVKTKILTEVGRILGHFSTKNGKQELQWRTSIQSYVRPEPIIQWFKNHDLETPKWVPKKMEDE